MSDINLIRNPRFQRGKPSPSHWSWKAKSRDVTWRVAPAGEADAAGVVVVSRGDDSGGRFVQTVRCKGGEWYRVDADVTCDLRGVAEGAGLRLEVSAREDRKAGMTWRSVALLTCEPGLALRTYLHVPEHVTELDVAVVVENAEGTARIHEVRVMRLLEPEEESHVMAIPLPPLAAAPPLRARRVLVCSETAEDRPVYRRLQAALGRECVAGAVPSKSGAAAAEADAVLLPDAKPPALVGSLRALLKLAEERVVVISVPAFAKLCAPDLRVKQVEQEDDPIHARLMFANYATGGIALHDAFAFAWSGTVAGSFVQNHFRLTPAAKQFLEKQKLHVLLNSVCDQDNTSDRPVALFRPTTGGALFVMDLEPAEAPGSTFAEPTLPMNLLLGMLGHGSHGLGQFVVAHRTEPDFRSMLREFDVRFSALVLHDEDLPVEQVRRQFITLGGREEGFGLPLKPKPAIIVRSGLTSGDHESVYAAMMWFKQFGRMVPHTCPYAEALASRFRFIWVPLQAEWDQGGGLQRGGRGPVTCYDLDLEESRIAALIDVGSRPVQQCRVVLAGNDQAMDRYAYWLPRLSQAFPPAAMFIPCVEPGEAFGNRANMAWRWLELVPGVEHEPAVALDDPMVQSVCAAGGQHLRIEIPGWDGDFASASIFRTALGATLLEHVIGLHYGMVGVNRTAQRRVLEGVADVGPGEALILDQADERLRMPMSQAG